MSIILVKLPQQDWSYGTSLVPARHCRLDPCSPGGQHAAFVDEGGVLHYQHVGAATADSGGSSKASTTTLLRFQLQYQPGEDAGLYEPIAKPWRFEFVPGMPGDLLLVQAGSCRILYASLPKRDSCASDVFLFGAHTAPVTCLSTSANWVLSGCADGALKLWRLADGQLEDAVIDPGHSGITAIEPLGPLLVAAGTASGSVMLYDTASGRLLAVQRLLAGPGAVACLAGWLPQSLLSSASLAGGGPRLPDGGGVLSGPGVGAGFRLQGEDAAAGVGRVHAASHALLAVASASGWLSVFEAALPGSSSWTPIHSSGSLLAAGACALAFTADGTSLAVASPAAQLRGMDAAAVAAAGGQPGTVSLYDVASGSTSSRGGGGGLAALLPPLLLEQQHQHSQLPELALWHQWSLSSAPVGLAVLPGSGFSLLHGKALQPMQVVQLLAVPEAGPTLVLRAERRMPQQQHQDSSEAPAAAAADAEEQDDAAGAAAGMLPSPRQQPQQQPSPCSVAAPDSDAGEDEELLLNLAQRDLAEVAKAIAAAAGPLHDDAELSALLADLQVSLRDSLPAGTDDAGGTQHCGPSAAAAPAVASSSNSMLEACNRLLQQQKQAEGAASAAPADDEGAGAAAAGAAGFKLPRTLPGLRSWMDPAAAVAAGLATPTAGAGALEALAADLHRQQQRKQQELLRQRQQEQQALEEQRQQQQQDALAAAQAAAGGSSSSAGRDAAAIDRAAAHGAEQELPSESSFQHMLQQQRNQQQHEAEPQPQVCAGLDVPPAASSQQQLSEQQQELSSITAAAEAMPEPRQLPLMLRQHQQLQHAPEAGPGGDSSSQSRRVPPAPVPRVRPAAVAPAAAVAVTAPSGAVQSSSSSEDSFDAAADATATAAATAASVAALQQQRTRQQPVSNQQQSAQQRLSLRRQQQQQRSSQLPAAAKATVAAAAAAAAAAGLPPAMPVSEHALAAAAANSSRLLARKIQEAEQTPDVVVDPSAPAALKLAAARLSGLDLGLEQEQYCYEALTDLRDVPTPTHAPRLVPKQLDAAWVAARSLKPSMDTLFKPQEWQQHFVDPQLLVLPAWPTPQQVVQQLTWSRAGNS